MTVGRDVVGEKSVVVAAEEVKPEATVGMADLVEEAIRGRDHKSGCREMIILVKEKGNHRREHYPASESIPNQSASKQQEAGGSSSGLPVDEKAKETVEIKTSGRRPQQSRPLISKVNLNLKSLSAFAARKLETLCVIVRSHGNVRSVAELVTIAVCALRRS